MKRLACVLLALFMAAGLALPACAEDDGYIDHYTKGNFSNTHAVYSGPGENYYRANEGKAMYGSGVLRYYGAEPGGWLMIGYITTRGIYRLGYINAKFEDMNTKGPDRALALKSLNAIVLSPLDFYDTPGIGERKVDPLCSLPKGAVVTYLGEFNADWTYVEISGSYLGKPSRGFVASGHLLSIAAGPGDGTSAGVMADGLAEFQWKTSKMSWKRDVTVASSGAWKAIPDVPWILLGADGNMLNIQLKQNPDGQERTGIIILSSGTSSAKIVVTQSGE